jgi:hypothetical protein
MQGSLRRGSAKVAPSKDGGILRDLIAAFGEEAPEVLAY